jgi:hypothetical protein
MFDRRLILVCVVAPLAAGAGLGCTTADNLSDAPPRPPVSVAVPPANPAPSEPPPAPPEAPAPAPMGPKKMWKPTVGMTWEWQLNKPLNLTYDVQVYDIDLFDIEPAQIAQLHAAGRKVICYVNLGAWENWRPDKDLFPPSVIGAQWPQFPREYWLDIRQWDLLAPAIRGRLDMAVAKGCDAVEPDNMDGYNILAHSDPGFPLTYEDQIKYNRQVAAEAHARGLAVGLKNDTMQAADLVNDFDFHVSEQCFEYNECSHLMDFIKAGKPIFEAEYNWTLPMFCPMAKQLGISAIRKSPKGLDSWREVCP